MIIVDTKYSVSDEAAERLARACSLIASGMINELPLSRTEIEGSDIYVNVSEYKTHELNNSLWEAHRKYADIHYVIDGSEQIACAPSDAMTVTQEYSDATDAVLGRAEGEAVDLINGRYVVLLPDTAHCPGVMLGSPEKVKKAVIKVRL